MADISKITLPNGDEYNLKDTIARQAIPFGICDSTSTSTVFTATVPGITELADGTCMLLQNSIVTSASGFTININNLGAKPVYSSMATGNSVIPTAPSRETTLFNINYTMLFVYSTTLVEGGCWILYRGYNSNDNSIGYQLRTSSAALKTADKSRYYRLFFTSADGTYWVPANTGTDNSATSMKTVNQRPINPFGRIIYYSATTNFAAESTVTASSCWSQYPFALGYSFNTTGAALTLTIQKPVYIKCAPQSDGSAIIDSTVPYVQDLPSTADGKIYIFLGIAYSETNVELYIDHPVYEYKDGAIRLYTNAITNNVINPATETPIVAGVGTIGTSIKYAREDHVHPAQTTINGHTINADVPSNAIFTDNTAYQVRGNSINHKMADQTYGYRLLFTSADGTKWVPANSDANATATDIKTPNTTSIDPFGSIVYYASDTIINSNALPIAQDLWQQHIASMGYSFNTTGAAITFTISDPIYIKCLPQTNGSAILQGYTQTLPTSKDGFIYIYLGVGLALGTFELAINHPIYFHDGAGIRLWTGNNYVVNSDVPANALFTDTQSNWNETDTSAASYIANKPVLHTTYITSTEPSVSNTGDVWFIIE